MVSEGTITRYERILDKVIRNCTDWRGIFVSDERFFDIARRVDQMRYKVHDRISKDQKARGEISGLPKQLLDYEGALMREEVIREAKIWAKHSYSRR